jgi:hypothetical protein
MPFCANGKLHDAGVGIARIRCKVEAEFLAHRKHRRVFKAAIAPHELMVKLGRSIPAELLGRILSE